jgi:protein required for attachment to host cells
MQHERLTTWVLIADAMSAKILVNRGRGTGLALLEDGSFAGVNLPARELAADRPGRTFDSAGHGRHAMEPPTDPKEVEKERFIRAIAGFLGQAAGRRAFDRLVVAAPPAALGLLRAALPDAAAALVAAEVGKDLTNVPEHELGRHLEAVVAL